MSEGICVPLTLWAQLLGVQLSFRTPIFSFKNTLAPKINLKKDERFEHGLRSFQNSISSENASCQLNGRGLTFLKKGAAPRELKCKKSDFFQLAALAKLPFLDRYLEKRS